MDSYLEHLKGDISFSLHVSHVSSRPPLQLLSTAPTTNFDGVGSSTLIVLKKMVLLSLCIYVWFSLKQVPETFVDVVSFDKKKLCAEAHIHPLAVGHKPLTARGVSSDPMKLGKLKTALSYC